MTPIVQIGRKDSKPNEGRMNDTVPRLRVLVVDDCKDSADMLCSVLELWEIEARPAYSGLVALGRFGTFRPHVLLLDLSMPKLDGIALGERIRELPNGSDAALIAVTGMSEDDYHVSCKLAGFDHFIAKPLDADALKSLLAAYDPRNEHTTAVTVADRTRSPDVVF